MDKKKHFASLMEDHSPDPSVEALRSLSPFRNGTRSGTGSGDGGSTCATPSHSGLGFDLDLDQDQQPVLSCVTKETSQEDCARHRFIVWAAVKRNSSVHMPAQQRLECPLLRCTRRFQDHESMLRHLAGCRYLASGEYWCYEHNRVERFDDLKCKRCLGHPSKRRKILRMAKNFFHSLGHKSRRTPGIGLDDDEAAPPPPYDSLNIPSLDGDATELLSTEILEIDSVEVPALNDTPMPAPSDAIDPQALLIPATPAAPAAPTAPTAPAIPELDSTMPSNETLMQWPPVSSTTPPPFSFAQQEYGAVRAQVAKPTLQLTTNGLPARRQAPRPAARPAPTIPRSKGLSPSSSVRSTASTDTNASMTSNGSSLVSPISNWSGVWSMGSGHNTDVTSPVEGMLTDELFADDMNNACPEFLHEFYSELPADLPLTKTACDMASDLVFGFEATPQVNMTYAPDIVLSEDPAEPIEIGEPEVEETNACCSETKSLVSSAWDALQEHIVSSMVKLQDHRDNPLANQLSSMSIKTVATTGLRTLRALISGRQPSCASDALCLVHLIYAFSLVLHEQEVSHRFSSLFLQSLTYAHSLQPIDRDFYRQLVISIWQPPDLTQADISNHFAMSSRSFGSSPDPKGKSPEMFGLNLEQQSSSDPLLVVARDFLDELEISVVLGQDSSSLDVQVQVSDLHIKHLKDINPSAVVNEALLVTVKYILEMLAREFGGAEGLNTRLSELYQRLSSGTISGVRRVEIELLHAGKCCLPVTEFWTSFVPNVRRLCDQVYQQLDVGTSRRDVYHGLGISLVETLISEFDNSTSKTADPLLNDFHALINDLASEASAATALAFTDLQTVGLPTFDLDLSRVQVPTVTKTPPGTSSISQTTSPAAEQGQQSASSETPEQQQSPGQKVEANSCCEICGYRPKGDPQWFKGSMAKHKKLQHSTEPPKIYECPYPGCTSRYKNRPDNLRQHQIEKNHWVQGDESTPRRPSKRKKVAADE
ncbi:hypothetical protein MFIFM68171_08901 [Madurella fahalii]|uniref:C2H2-type domain-containing protein n=1 Tax=Madurella fahalii TaxID=1157608 RepID=A0ABQ0GLR5_9PEZI